MVSRYQWVYNDRRYKKARKIVMHRDGGICQRCKSAPGVECHHKIPLDDINANRHKPDVYICFSPRNMEMLCHDCHNGIDADNCADDVIVLPNGDIIQAPPGVR